MVKKIFMVVVVVAMIICMFGTTCAQEDGVRVKALTSQSIVRVASPDGIGTGFFVSDRHIVTNHHVVSPFLKDGYVGGEGWWTYATNQKVDVIFSLINNDVVGGLVVQDWPEVDLAVVEIDPVYSKRLPLKLLPDSEVNEGMNVWSTGFPGVNSRDSLTDDNSTITSGVLSKIYHNAIGSNSTPFYALSFDSIINPGNSGGPIVDRNGNVVGIANSSSGTGIAFYGIHVKELTARLTAAGIPFIWADFGLSEVLTDIADTPAEEEEKTDVKTIILWSVIGLLGLSVIGLLVYMIRKPAGKTVQVSTKIPTGLTGTVMDKTMSSSSSKASIQGLSGQFSGQKKPLSQTKDCIIGKDPSVCTFVFDESAKRVSRKHCRIHYSKTNQRFIIQDLKSTNGTILVRGSSEKKIPTDSAIALKDGDLVYIPDKNNSFRINL